MQSKTAEQLAKEKEEEEKRKKLLQLRSENKKSQRFQFKRLLLKRYYLIPIKPNHMFPLGLLWFFTIYTVDFISDPNACTKGKISIL